MYADKSQKIRINSRGDACPSGTNIPVWHLHLYRRDGYSDEWILANFRWAGLTTEQLAAAWRHFDESRMSLDPMFAPPL